MTERTSEMWGGISAEEATARASRLFGRCQHERAEHVVLTTGEIVASVCVNCLQRLPASWGCADCEYGEIRTLGDPLPARILTSPCRAHV
jgi:hypothetical protein